MPVTWQELGEVGAGSRRAGLDRLYWPGISDNLQCARTVIMPPPKK